LLVTVLIKVAPQKYSQEDKGTLCDLLSRDCCGYFRL